MLLIKLLSEQQSIDLLGRTVKSLVSVETFSDRWCVIRHWETLSLLEMWKFRNDIRGGIDPQIRKVFWNFQNRIMWKKYPSFIWYFIKSIWNWPKRRSVRSFIWKTCTNVFSDELLNIEEYGITTCEKEKN